MTIETKYNIGDVVWYMHTYGHFVKKATITGYCYEQLNNDLVLTCILDHQFGERMAESLLCPDLAELKKNYDANKEARWREMTEDVQHIIDKQNEFLEVARSINENVQAEAEK